MKKKDKVTPIKRMGGVMWLECPRCKKLIVVAEKPDITKVPSGIGDAPTEALLNEILTKWKKQKK